VQVQWFFIALSPGSVVDRDRIAAMAGAFFSMQLGWDAPGGAPDRLRPGVSVRAWLKPGSLVGAILERTPEGVAIGVPHGASPSDWGLALCLASAFGRDEAQPVLCPDGTEQPPEGVLAQAEPQRLWKGWVEQSKQAFKFVASEKRTLTLSGIRDLYLGPQVTKTCIDSKDPARTLLRVLNRSAHLIGLEGYEEALPTLNEEEGDRWWSVRFAPERPCILRNPEWLELEGAPPHHFLPLPALGRALGKPLEQLDELTFAIPAVSRAEWSAFLGRAKSFLVRFPRSGKKRQTPAWVPDLG